MRRAKALATIVTLSLSMVACGGETATDSDAPAPDGSQPATDPGEAEEFELVVGGIAADVSLDPNLTNAADWLSVLTNMYDTLVTRDASGEVVPALAASWQATDDTTWELTLRDDVTFHDGSPFSAEDVKFTLERVMDPDTESQQLSYIASLEQVDVVDDYIVQLTLSRVDPLFIQNLMFVPIASAAYVNENGAEALANDENGTGPFQLEEWVQGDHLTLSAFDDYWRGTPEVETVVFREYPEAASLVAALETGEVDIAVNVPPESALAFADASGFGTKSVESSRSLFIVLDDTVEPLDDLRVRQALNLATDLDTLTEDLLLGFADPLGTQLPSMYLGSGADTIDPYPYDPEQARSLLADAGYPDGFELELNAPTGRYLKDREVAQAIAGQWGEVGITVDLNLQEFGTYLNEYRAHTLGPAYLIGFGTPVWDSALGLQSYLNPENPQSYFRGDDVWSAVEAVLPLTEEAERESALEEINRRLHDQAAFVFLYQQHSIYGVSDRVAWEPRIDERVWLYEAAPSQD